MTSPSYLVPLLRMLPPLPLNQGRQKISYFVPFFKLNSMFFKKATKIDEIFTIDLTICSKRQIDSEDFVNFCGLLRKYELYHKVLSSRLQRLNEEIAFTVTMTTLLYLVPLQIELPHLPLNQASKKNFKLII
jgi:hypothetical protein